MQMNTETLESQLLGVEQFTCKHCHCTATMIRSDFQQDYLPNQPQRAHGRSRTPLRAELKLTPAGVTSSRAMRHFLEFAVLFLLFVCTASSVVAAWTSVYRSPSAQSSVSKTETAVLLLLFALTIVVAVVALHRIGRRWYLAAATPKSDGSASRGGRAAGAPPSPGFLAASSAAGLRRSGSVFAPPSQGVSFHGGADGDDAPPQQQQQHLRGGPDDANDNDDVIVSLLPVPSSSHYTEGR